MASSNFDEPIENIQKSLQSVSRDILHDEKARKKLLGITMQSMTMLETPLETIWRMIMSPHAPAALMTFIKMGGIESMVKDNKPKTAAELARDTGADKLLIIRILRPLIALGILQETDVETYNSTPISQMLTAPPLIGGYQFMFAAATKSLADMPNYLASTGFKHVDGSPGPFQYAHDQNPAAAHGLFPWLISDPAMLTNFNAFMSGQRMNREQWYDFFPVNEILLKGAKQDHESTLLVDIAGGAGHDAESFHRRFPDAPGKVIVQDLPETIDSIKQLDPAVVRMKYDFFTHQPVHGAKAYYFRSIFHDWPDSECIKILQNTAAAMLKGYSKLLISEWVLPAKDVPLYPALLDINMMALLNGMERTEAQWTTLLEAAGFRVVNFWTIGPETEGLVEAVLKD